MSDIFTQRGDSPYIFSFPHSGEMLIGEMKWKLRDEAQHFLPNVDWHLMELYGFLQTYNVDIIYTPFSRYVIDVNRPPNVQKLGNYRCSLVYDTNTWDEEIYHTPPSEEEIERRIKRYYEPYHSELKKLIAKKIERFGKVYLIDLHSFMGPISADVCLGNRHNVTCSETFINKVAKAFTSAGFETVKNDVFIGGYISKNYAIKGVVETLQIELRYTNYIEEHELDIQKTPSRYSSLFKETSLRLEEVFNEIGIEKKPIPPSPPILPHINLPLQDLLQQKLVWLGLFVVAILLSLMKT